MEPDPAIRAAGPEDYESVRALLAASGLPVKGLAENFSHGLVARGEDGRLAGSVSLEMYGSAALLRSLVVAPELRGKGLGERLTARALSLAASSGVCDVYLLTETAAEFFPRFGFAAEDRAGAPEALKASAEFRSACPASAILMRARVRG